MNRFDSNDEKKSLCKKNFTAIILHPDAELSVINFQKKLISLIHKKLDEKDEENQKRKNIFFYAHLPLLIELNGKNATSKDDLKKIASEIQTVEFGKKLYCEENQIFSTVKITWKNQNKFESPVQNKSDFSFEKLPLLHLYKIENTSQNKNCILQNQQKEDFLQIAKKICSNEEKNFPLEKIRTFKIAQCNSFSENKKNITEITDFVWTKKNS